MSIYPVKINQWFLNKKELENIKTFLPNLKCNACGKKANTRGYVYHAILHGYGIEDYWCSIKCLRK